MNIFNKNVAIIECGYKSRIFFNSLIQLSVHILIQTANDFHTSGRQNGVALTVFDYHHHIVI